MNNNKNNTPPPKSSPSPPSSPVMSETGTGFAPANPRTSKVVLSPQRTPIVGAGKGKGKGTRK